MAANFSLISPDPQMQRLHEELEMVKTFKVVT
jgi:hypothetical protein